MADSTEGEQQRGRYVDFTHSANREVLSHLGAGEHGRVFAPHEVDTFQLGTHPDLVDYLWTLGGEAMRGACVVAARPVLSHPTSGIIFGLAGGTKTLAMRLPDPEHADAVATPGYGARLTYPSGDLLASDLGPDWVFLEPFAEENQTRFRVAWANAGALA